MDIVILLYLNHHAYTKVPPIQYIPFSPLLFISQFMDITGHADTIKTIASIEKRKSENACSCVETDPSIINHCACDDPAIDPIVSKYASIVIKAPEETHLDTLLQVVRDDTMNYIGYANDSARCAERVRQVFDNADMTGDRITGACIVIHPHSESEHVEDQSHSRSYSSSLKLAVDNPATKSLEGEHYSTGFVEEEDLDFELESMALYADYLDSKRDPSNAIDLNLESLDQYGLVYENVVRRKVVVRNGIQKVKFMCDKGWRYDPSRNTCIKLNEIELIKMRKSAKRGARTRKRSSSAAKRSISNAKRNLSSTQRAGVRGGFL